MIIGIVGGGQLGMMMAEAAKPLNHYIVGLDPNPTCSLSLIADEMIIAPYNDPSAFTQLVDRCDVITYEFENVELSLIEKNIMKIPQKREALYLSRNRILEKKFAESLLIPTPHFSIVNSKDDIFQPSIIKTATGGYDGKGQFKYSDKTHIDQFILNPEIEYICEELISFDYEISVVATRDKFGSIIYLPIPKNIHRNGILWQSITTANIPLKVQTKAREFTEKIITKLDYIGTLTVEFFVQNNNVIFNEFAPRPHNSGHYSIEATNASQFKNHILAVTGEKVIEPVLLKNSIMINVLGQDWPYVERIDPLFCVFHDYFKEESKPDRKMGHITCVHDSHEVLDNIRQQIIGDHNE